MPTEIGQGGRRPRVTLARLMATVAVFAVVFATLPPIFGILFSCVLIAVAGLGWVVSAATGASWSRVAAWGFACYPFLLQASVYTTWLAAWWSLGHIPRPWLDDPEDINGLGEVLNIATWVLSFGFIPSFVISLLLAIVEVASSLGGRERVGRVVAMAVLPLISWPLGFLWFRVDPGGVLDWFFD